jgi:hypothetical protein
MTTLISRFQPSLSTNSYPPSLPTVSCVPLLPTSFLHASGEADAPHQRSRSIRRHTAVAFTVSVSCMSFAKQLPLRVLRHLDQRVLPTCQDLPREGVRTLPTVRMLSIHLVAVGGLECLIRHGLHPFARHSSRTRSCRATTLSSVSLALAEPCPIDL